MSNNTVIEYPRWADPVGRCLRVEQEMKRVLTHLDPTGPRQGTDDTPNRVARMWIDELVSGYQVDVASLFRTFDAGGYDGMIQVRDIPVVSTCEHHLVPFIGHAHVGYFPSDKVVGLSKIPRVVHAFSRRLQIQERLTKQVCDAMVQHLNPRGVIVVFSCEHLCMSIRGVQAPGTKTVTSAVTGYFEENKDGCREEFLRLLAI